ncbi:MAG TPA: HlyC/CorC family transporter [Aestuariivirga sp.]|jgi:Mg2+/Co2+ transporter CorB|nr:HlyC/CorC family transporter [Aestuariivirga sp.]
MSFDLSIPAVAIVFLLLLSAFFSGSETALTATSRARLTELERRGSWRASIALSLTKSRERLIGALLLGNNVVNISASALATAVLVKAFGDSGAVIASAVMTVLVLIFGEVMPKTYAIAYPDRVALTVAPIVRVLVAAFGPVVIAVEYIVKKALAVLGVNVSNVNDVLSAHDELRGTIDLHHKEGSFITQDRNMLGGILDLQDLEVLDAMIHRTKMMSIDASDTTEKIVKQVLKSGHTRFPVWKDSQDNIVGILHAKNLFAALQENDGDSTMIKIEDVMSPAWFVPDTRPLADQLKAFLRRKTHFAIVVDEYGEVQGLITLEDIIEEIIGDIKDEHDFDTIGIKPQPDGSYVVEGAVPLRDLNRALNWNLPDEEATTIAGLVIHEARMIPDVGQVFNFHGFRLEVLKKRKHQVTSVKLTPENSG